MSELESPVSRIDSHDRITALTDPNQVTPAAGDGGSNELCGASEGQRKRGRRLRLREMRVRHVRSCLSRLKLEQYAHAFEVHAIDGYMCDFLDDDLLEHQLGMRQEEHRKRFLAWVAQMQIPR